MDNVRAPRHRCILAQPETQQAKDRAYFGSIGANAFVDLTEYLSRVGEFLRAQGHVCRIMSLNATPYSVNVIVATELSTDEMGDLLRDYRLAPAN